MPAEVIAGIWAGIRDGAERSGRNPDDLQLVVRANVRVTPTPQDGGRAPFTGTISQIAGDVCASADVGAHELIIDVQADARTGEEVLDLAERIVDAAEVRQGHHLPSTAITTGPVRRTFARA